MTDRLVLKAHHFRKRHALGRDRDRLNDAGVLHRKEPFRHEKKESAVSASVASEAVTSASDAEGRRRACDRIPG